MRPSYHPEGLYDENKVSIGNKEKGTNPITQLWHMNGKCPEDRSNLRSTFARSNLHCKLSPKEN